MLFFTLVVVGSLAKVKAKLENKVLCLSAQTRLFGEESESEKETERQRQPLASLPVPPSTTNLHGFFCIAQVCGNHDDDADDDDDVADADEELDDKFAHSCAGQWPHLKCN